MRMCCYDRMGADAAKYGDACRSESGLCGVQGLRAALNAALFRTGDQSRDFAVVLATNRPADLDPAVLDRMDEALEFPLPGPAERAAILQLYVDSYIAKAGTAEGRDYLVRSAETMSHELGWKQREDHSCCVQEHNHSPVHVLAWGLCAHECQAMART